MTEQKKCAKVIGKRREQDGVLVQNSAGCRALLFRVW